MSVVDIQQLNLITNEENWDQLLELVKPKHFVKQNTGEPPNAAVLAQICWTLINETSPDMVKILCLKCLGNSCLDSYKYKQHTLANKEPDKYKYLYHKLAENVCQYGQDCDYPHGSYFPYDGIIEWTINYINICDKSTSCLTDNEIDIFRLSIQFLCNLFTYACKNVTSVENENILQYLNCDNLKQAVIISENAKSLIINCKYLLMSLHMMGKESNNYFTPITNLSQVAPNAQRRAMNINTGINNVDISEETTNPDPQDHPAYGFKSGLIKVIGNMVYRNKMCQDLFREIDGIPLLLDCCNIDARNPLMLQWSILALRNLCEGNPENQEIIRHCRREGVVDNVVLQEMGLTLHEDMDGKSIRIAPLRRD
ncbi:Ataxin-10 [Harpegnathos saltator]|uniref:Ataxin-10 n=1 Tax=Harpegnathos saltator TaxID=610380 RepID=E2BCA5_HARSA|nr:Ataxin-10 [Harpegnathos saltator]